MENHPGSGEGCINKEGWSGKAKVAGKQITDKKTDLYAGGIDALTAWLL